MLYTYGMVDEARLEEERSTQRRARILGMDYVDTGAMADKPLYKDILSVPELKELRVVPVHADQSNILFGVTTTTSQQTMAGLQPRFPDQRVTMAIVSDTGFGEYMRLYDPPKEIVYHDIEINTAGTADL